MATATVTAWRWGVWTARRVVAGWHGPRTAAAPGGGRPRQQAALHVLPQRLPLFHADSDAAETTRDTPQRLLQPIQRALADFPGFEWKPGRAALAEHLLLAHSAAQVQAVLAPTAGATQATGPTPVAPPSSSVIVHPSLRVVGAALDALDAIFRDGYRIAGTLSGGHHHVAHEGGLQEAPFNDLAVAAAVAVHKYGLERVLVCDLDGSPGRGTASIFRNEPRVVTFSMHAATARAGGVAPAPTGDIANALTGSLSTYEVTCPDGTRDTEYLELLRALLRQLVDKVQPQLVIYHAGVSVLGSGQLSLTRQGLQERNRLVYATALAHGVPVLVTCGAAAASAEHQRLAEDPAVRDVVVQANADVYRGAYQTIVTHNHRQFFF